MAHQTELCCFETQSLGSVRACPPVVLFISMTLTQRLLLKSISILVKFMVLRCVAYIDAKLLGGYQSLRENSQGSV